MRRALAAACLLAVATAAHAADPGTPPAAPGPAAVAPGPAAAVEVATFASGCFWCTESDFEKVPGVVDVVSGYIGGTRPDPTYHEVGAGGTGYAEAVEVRFDPARVTYAQLLDVFWHGTDPLDGKGQFCDRGDQYRSEIFYHGDEQRRLAEDSKAAIERSHRLGLPIVTRIEPATAFYRAEDYHQDYYKKNPVRYHYYRWNCGRDQRLTEIWGADKPGT